MDEAGQEMAFAPLEEMADLCLEGILADNFWITAVERPPGRDATRTRRLADRPDAA